MRILIDDLCSWARGTEEDWAKFLETPQDLLPLKYHSRAALASADSELLAEDFFQHIPLQAQMILGKDSLTPSDLLDLPQGAEDSPHHVVYLDILARMDPEEIIRAESPFFNFRKLKVKTVQSGVNPKDAKEFRVYNGSSARTEGVRGHIREQTYEGNRILEDTTTISSTMPAAHAATTHPSSSTPATTKPVAEHYQYSRQAGVVQNFRLIAVWDNPPFLPANSDQDTIYHGQSMCFEAISMTFLGMCPTPARSYHPEAVVNLNELLRVGKDLPDLSAHSLNRAWPFQQDGRAGPRAADGKKFTVPSRSRLGWKCTNPTCPYDPVTAPQVHGWSFFPRDMPPSMENCICHNCNAY